MPRAKKLTNAELFFVQEKSKAGVTAADIALQLDVPVKSVEPHMVVPEPAPPAPRQETLTSQAFARHKNRPGTVIMTPAASQLGESKAPIKFREDCIAKTKQP